MEPLLPLAIRLPAQGTGLRLREFHRQLRDAIVDGRLRPGLRLPATRVLAEAFGIARNTVVTTYELLASEGYVVSRHGSGTTVATSLPLPPKPQAESRRLRPDRRLAADWRDAALPSPRGAALPIDFRLGVPDAREFPVDTWRRLTLASLRGLRSPASLDTDPQGRPAFRQAIADHVSFARAVACSPDDVIVTAGAQQAFELLARVLVTPGRTRVALEDPGYPPLRRSFAAQSARISAVPVDDEGLRVDRLPRDADVLCVTPSHQFPLGCVLSAPRRTALLDFARARGAVVIEDDYDGEFRFGERPLDALKTLDRSESVFFVGTFSKSLLPSLRLGYIVAPRWARAALVAAKTLADGQGSPLLQDTVAALIREGHLARHVRRMQQGYGARRQRLLDALDDGLLPWLEPVPSTAGLHLTARLRRGRDDQALVAVARSAGVGLRALGEFGVGRRAPRGIVFGYGALDEPRLVEGLSRLQRAWAAV